MSELKHYRLNVSDTAFQPLKQQRFTRNEAAEYLKISVITVDRMLLSKKIGCFRIGRRVLFSREHLDRFLSDCEQPAKRLVA